VLGTWLLAGRTTATFAGAMFFSIAYMQFLGLAECAETMQRLPVFYKQRFNLIFPGWAYAVPFAFIRIPITLVEVTFWSIVVYWVIGLETDASRCARLSAPPLAAL
jgi:ABC-2 type transporter